MVKSMQIIVSDISLSPMNPSFTQTILSLSLSNISPLSNICLYLCEKEETDNHLCGAENLDRKNQVLLHQNG